jgi:hypothetical protein
MEEESFDPEKAFEDFIKEQKASKDERPQDASNHVAYDKDAYDRIMAFLPMAMQLNAKVNTFKYSKLSTQERYNKLFQTYEKLFINSQALFWPALTGELESLQLYEQMNQSQGSFSKFIQLQRKEDETILKRFEEIKAKHSS